MLNCIPLITSKSYSALKSFDSLLIVAKTLSDLKPYNDLHDSLSVYKEKNSSFEKEVSFVVSDHQRIIYSPIGSLNLEIDDVRRVGEASYKALKKAISVGSRSPLLINLTRNDFLNSDSVALLGALSAAYTPIEVREVNGNKQKIDKMGFYHENDAEAEKILTIVNAIEIGRTVTRDIAGSDPERMSAIKVLEYVQETFDLSCVKIDVVDKVEDFENHYPCFAAVNRAAHVIPRHRGRIIKLEYNPPEDTPVDTTLFLVGKGINYDTGGADIKYGGTMQGMHRDKSGAAFVAGFFKMLSFLKPKGLKVYGTMAMARNSVGEDAYVSDEIITSRANVRIRIGNTDAEGRMVMTDTLCEAKEKALGAINPFLFTIATLTGHVVRAYGPNYSSIMCNGVARSKKLDHEFQEVGEAYADPFEISTIRREDYDFHKGKTEYEHVIQANNRPSTETARGHQGPAAYLVMASGLDKHGIGSEKPLPYAHCDIAGSSGFPPDLPTATPLLTFAFKYVVPRII